MTYRAPCKINGQLLAENAGVCDKMSQSSFQFPNVSLNNLSDIVQYAVGNEVNFVVSAFLVQDCDSRFK